MGLQSGFGRALKSVPADPPSASERLTCDLYLIRLDPAVLKHRKFREKNRDNCRRKRMRPERAIPRGRKREEF